MSKHTGLRVARYDEHAQCWVVLTPDGHIFAECPETVYSEGHERAKLLVDSVNNHSRLVEALRDVKHGLESKLVGSPEFTLESMIEGVDRVLAELESES